MVPIDFADSASILENHKIKAKYCISNCTEIHIDYDIAPNKGYSKGYMLAAFGYSVRNRPKIET
jgi:hypothetical protein